MVSLLCGFIQPTSGRILVDGVDLRELDVAAYRERISAILHQDFLLPRPLVDNLKYRAPDACKASAIEGVIQGLGLQKVQERDLERIVRVKRELAQDPDRNSRYALPEDIALEQNLQVSAGERHRIAIGRQLLHGANVWFLDEATANVDGRMEEIIFDAIFERPDLLLLTISHRLSCVRAMPRIYVLDTGRITGEGTHDELIRSHPVYRSMFEPQLVERHGPASRFELRQLHAKGVS